MPNPVEDGIIKDKILCYTKRKNTKKYSTLPITPIIARAVHTPLFP